jgi:hypothetical protein
MAWIWVTENCPDLKDSAIRTARCPSPFEKRIKEIIGKYCSPSRYREPSFRISLQQLVDFAASLTVPAEMVGGAYGTTVGDPN